MADALTELIEDVLERKLKELRTGFIGRVLSVKGDRADIQPVTDSKHEGQAAKPAPMIPGVPMLEHVELAPGDLCYCSCADRDISQAIKGLSTVQQKRRHSLADAVIIGVLK